MNAAAVALAYKQCERITRSRARNFYYGIRLLPPRQRSAMCALYAMARRIDDIGDGPGAAGAADNRLHALQEVRTSLELLAKATGEGTPAVAAPPGDPVLTALADTARQFPVPIGAFLDLVEGCEWDIAGRRYGSCSELVEYCRRVAGTIGRLSLAVYGVDAALRGRRDDLVALICFETGRAAEWYERGMALLPLLDKRSRACTAAMTGIYRRLLDKIRVDPEAVLHGRLGLSSAEKLAVAARAMTTGTA